MKVKVQVVVEYKGHNVSANGVIKLTLKAKYSALADTVKLLQMLNNDVYIKVKLSDGTKMNLGYFKIDQIINDGDGESTIKLKDTVDSVEMDNISRLPFGNDDITEFNAMFTADVEVEDEEGEEDE